MSKRNIEIAIVGGGLVGSLEACFLGSRGYNVKVYEYRKDIREMEHVQGRSINLALSVRGREALCKVGLEDEVLKRLATPMYARMIHNVDGTLSEIPYGQSHECIYSVSRRILNEILLTAAEKCETVKLNFEHKVTKCDIRKRVLTFSHPGGHETESKADLIVGCDGTFSAIRRSMMQVPGFNFNQTWIDHGYMELCMLPNAEGKYKMKENYLHIWPRGSFMMIALPNMDRSFTMTLFMPFHLFDELTSDEVILEFFQKYFPDSIDLIGKEKLLEDFSNTEASRLVYIKCSPHNVGNSVLLLGDAAHAMVPFYGQGMNCGFEDCLLFDEILEKYSCDFERVLPEYSRKRTPDAHAIVDLALYNYLEMRDHVNSLSFILRKKMDNIIFRIFPKAWIPLYSMVTFSRIRYHECIRNREWQDQVIQKVKRALQATATTIFVLSVWKLHQVGAVAPHVKFIRSYVNSVLKF